MTNRRNKVDQIIKPNNEGYCRICNSFGKLSEDHVPPKCLGNKGQITLRLGGKVKTMQAGIKFKTICSKCNNMLGRKYDTAFDKLYQDMLYLKNNDFRPFSRFHCFSIVPNDLLRSFCGHLLAIWFGDNPEDEVILPTKDNELVDSMKKFVLGKISSINFVEFYYWFYPYEEFQINQFWGKLVPNDVGKLNNIYGSTLKTFPLSIWMVHKESSTAFPHLRILPQIDDKIILKVDLKKIHDKNWPEMDNNGISLMSLDSKFDFLK